MILVNKKNKYFLIIIASIFLFSFVTTIWADDCTDPAIANTPACTGTVTCPAGQMMNQTGDCVPLQTVSGTNDSAVNLVNTSLSGSKYSLLTTLPGIGGSIPQEGAFGVYLQTLFNLGIGIAIALSVIMIVIGGAQYLSTDAITGKEDGRKKLNSAVGGLVLALGIYIILNTINPNLLKLNLGLGNLSQSNIQIPQNSGIDPSSPPLQGTEESKNSAITDDARVRGILEGAGIVVKTPACTAINQQSCTSVGGLPNKIIDGLKGLKNQCPGCEIIVTGGTEYWLHSTHGPGIDVVDLRPMPSLNQFLGKPFPTSGDFVRKGMMTFKYEVVGDNVNATGAHWHVINL